MQQQDPGSAGGSIEEYQNAPMAFGDEDLLGLSVEELDAQCDIIFETPPVQFSPSEQTPLNKAIADQIDLLDITVPVVHLHRSLYLIGNQRYTLKLSSAGKLMVRVGAGYVRFDDFVPAQHRSL